MWIELTNTWIIIANVLGIPVAHVLLSWLCTIAPARWFDKPLPKQCPKPHGIYETLFLIRSWKHLLPDAAPWIKGFPKDSIQSTKPDYLRRFILETRRGELAHWLQWLVISSFITWNPYPANLVILVYAMLVNLPCILNLRYTRIRLGRVLSKIRI